MADTHMLTCMDSFVAATKNGRRQILAGQTVRSDDPIVKGREALFVRSEELAARAADTAGVIGRDRPVETATAVPGEKRNTGRSAAKRAASKG